MATGSLAPEHLADLYSVAQVLVLPSTNSTESFGMVQVEAMLCGVPVVASDLPGVRQPVRMTGMGEIAPVKDAAGLAQRLLSVLESPERYRRPREEIDRTFVRRPDDLGVRERLPRGRLREGKPSCTMSFSVHSVQMR